MNKEKILNINNGKRDALIFIIFSLLLLFESCIGHGFFGRSHRKNNSFKESEFFNGTTFCSKLLCGRKLEIVSEKSLAGIF